jgi:hypothetical protein
MPDTHPTASPSGPDNADEIAVLDLLVHGENQRPWSAGEIELAIGNPITAADAVANLHAAGLVHRTSDGFVFATKAALRFHELSQ